MRDALSPPAASDPSGDDALDARGVSVNGCPKPDCPCGSLIVRLHDDQGRILAGVVLPKAVAKVFGAQVAALIEPKAATDLSAIRCQGVA